MQQYLNLLRHIRETARSKDDRTGTGTISVFGYQFRCDISHTIPLLTTKKIHFKSVIHELLWIIAGDTSNDSLEEKGVRIWREWATPEHCAKQGRAPGDLGPLYGSAWREWRASYVALVPPRVKDVEPPVSYPLWSLEEPDERVRVNSALGRKHANASGQEFSVLREYKPEGADRNVYDIQFIATGFVKKGVAFSAVKEGGIVKDLFAPDIYGVACLGESAPGADAFEKGLYQQWFSMVRRCYDSEHPGYPNYGGKGVFVCNRWLVYSQWRSDVPRVRGWRERRLNPTGIELDKDFYSSNCYAPDTCVWLSQALNTAYTGKAVEAITAGGETRWYLSQNEAARDLGLSAPTVAEGLRTGSAAGCIFKELVGPYRLITMVDQLAWVISELRTNPNSRRLVITAWNPANSYRVALETCHCLFQFYAQELTFEERHKVWITDAVFGDNKGISGMECVETEENVHLLNAAGIPKHRLSCQLYQRSADVFLGVPFNLACYALLTRMVAQVVNMVPGEFIHTFGDVHIYNNHLEQVDLQLSREPYPLPRLSLNPAVKEIDDFKFEDFEIVGYNSHPAIKAEVSV